MWQCLVITEWESKQKLFFGWPGSGRKCNFPGRHSSSLLLCFLLVFWCQLASSSANPCHATPFTFFPESRLQLILDPGQAASRIEAWFGIIFHFSQMFPRSRYRGSCRIVYGQFLGSLHSLLVVHSSRFLALVGRRRSSRNYFAGLRCDTWTRSSNTDWGMGDDLIIRLQNDATPSFQTSLFFCSWPSVLLHV